MTLATARLLARYRLCFVLPVTACTYLVTAPHPGPRAYLWLLVIVGSILADVGSRAERGDPPATRPGWPFDAVLYVLAGLQFANIALLVRAVARAGASGAEPFVATVLVGVNSGYSALVVAHELIHRPRRHMQLLGRALLCTVLYEHFFTEHIRGHHARVGTPEDPATARFGETAIGFFIRTVPAQFRSAWRLEKKRLGDEHMPLWDRRLLHSRVVHGLAVEWGVAFAILGAVGRGAFTIFFFQALLAIRLLEAVNYFEHWGLVRGQKRVHAVDSWDTDSRFTLYTLIGLARHADHHVEAARPYHELRLREESPKLPYGYFGCVVLAIAFNHRFRAHLAAELERRQLGPSAAMEDVA
jgi:alkane 1-monooxygenase